MSMEPKEPWWRQTSGAHGQGARIDIYGGIPYNNFDGGQNCAKLTLPATINVTCELDLATFQDFTGTFWVSIGNHWYYPSDQHPSETQSIAQGVYNVSFDCTIIVKEGIKGKNGTIKVYVKDSNETVLGTFLLHYTILGGILSVQSEPISGVNVYLDDVKIGTTPLQTEQGGEHTLKVDELV